MINDGGDTDLEVFSRFGCRIYNRRPKDYSAAQRGRAHAKKIYRLQRVSEREELHDRNLWHRGRGARPGCNACLQQPRPYRHPSVARAASIHVEGCSGGEEREGNRVSLGLPLLHFQGQNQGTFFSRFQIRGGFQMRSTAHGAKARCDDHALLDDSRETISEGSRHNRCDEL